MVYLFTNWSVVIMALGTKWSTEHRPGIELFVYCVSENGTDLYAY